MTSINRRLKLVNHYHKLGVDPWRVIKILTLVTSTKELNRAFVRAIEKEIKK